MKSQTADRWLRQLAVKSKHRLSGSIRHADYLLATMTVPPEGNPISHHSSTGGTAVPAEGALTDLALLSARQNSTGRKRGGAKRLVLVERYRCAPDRKPRDWSVTVGTEERRAVWKEGADIFTTGHGTEKEDAVEVEGTAHEVVKLRRLMLEGESVTLVVGARELEEAAVAPGELPPFRNGAHAKELVCRVRTEVRTTSAVRAHIYD